MGTYSVTVTDSIGCVITDSIDVELDDPPADNMSPEICYVSVDPRSGYNKIRLRPISNSLLFPIILSTKKQVLLFIIQ